MPSHHRVLVSARRRSLRLLFPALVLSLTPAVFADAASAAPPTPQSSTSCWGWLTKDPSATPTSDDPNLLDYKFRCDGDITAYTVIVNRRLGDFENMSDFSTSVNVLDRTGAVVPTASFTCEGALPGSGVNCNAGAGGVMTAWHYANGNFNLTDPYCKNIPAGSPPGTLAEPRALVQLIVTDATGAQDGPFRLDPTSACAAVPDRVPLLTPKGKPKSKHHKRVHKARGHLKVGHR